MRLKLSSDLRTTSRARMNEWMQGSTHYQPRDSSSSPSGSAGGSKSWSERGGKDKNSVPPMVIEASLCTAPSSSMDYHNSYYLKYNLSNGKGVARGVGWGHSPGGGGANGQQNKYCTRKILIFCA
jgi:hypothetical protein